MPCSLRLQRAQTPREFTGAAETPFNTVTKAPGEASDHHLVLADYSLWRVTGRSKKARFVRAADVNFATGPRDSSPGSVRFWCGLLRLGLCSRRTLARRGLRRGLRRGRNHFVVAVGIADLDGLGLLGSGAGVLHDILGTSGY